MPTTSRIKANSRIARAAVWRPITWSCTGPKSHVMARSVCPRTLAPLPQMPSPPLPEGVEIQYSYGFGAVGQGAIPPAAFLGSLLVIFTWRIIARTKAKGGKEAHMKSKR